MQRRELREQARRNVGTLQVQEPRHERAGSREIDRQAAETVQHERRRPMELLADDLERVLPFEVAMAPSKYSPNSTGPIVSQPMTTDGIASAISGPVTTHGVSCRCSFVWWSMRSFPWNTTNNRRKL